MPRKKKPKPDIPEDSYIPSYQERKSSEITNLVKNEMTFRHFSPDMKSEAFAMYMYGHSLHEISAKFGTDENGQKNVTVGQLKDWAQHYKWDESRADVWAESYGKMIQPFANCGTYAYQAGLAILADQLRIKMAKNEELEWDEIKKLSDVISSIQKVARLDEGKATEITEQKTLREQKQEIRLILKADPFQEFYDAIEVKSEEVKEIEQDSSDGTSDSNTGAE